MIKFIQEVLMNSCLQIYFTMVSLFQNPNLIYFLLALDDIIELIFFQGNQMVHERNPRSLSITFGLYLDVTCIRYVQL